MGFINWDNTNLKEKAREKWQQRKEGEDKYRYKEVKNDGLQW